METVTRRSVVTKIEGGWDGVEREGYVPGIATAVTRHTLIGHRKDDSCEPGPTSEVRYFDVPPGAVTRLEKHEHEHFVIVGHGTGHAIVGNTVTPIAQHDVVYVAPWEPHQFVNRGTEAFGFFCMVPAARDISQELSADELAALLASPAGAYADPHGAPPPRKRLPQ
ncbi:MAG: cupin domain-containing protein [Candidatus Eremiobacteraeota bacterium]|nr:cupin domain-containing protein [Candidatus Eremiobacteraeota bacterium]